MSHISIFRIQIREKMERFRSPAQEAPSGLNPSTYRLMSRYLQQSETLIKKGGNINHRSKVVKKVGQVKNPPLPLKSNQLATGIPKMSEAKDGGAVVGLTSVVIDRTSEGERCSSCRTFVKMTRKSNTRGGVHRKNAPGVHFFDATADSSIPALRYAARWSVLPSIARTRVEEEEQGNLILSRR